LKIAIIGGTFWDIFIYGEEAHRVEILQSPGGSGLNVAFGLYRLGFEVAFFSNLGRDLYASEIVRILQGFGFETCGMKVREGETGLHIALNEKPVGVNRGVNRLQVEFDALSEYDFVFVNCEVPPETIRRVCREAKEVFLDLGPLSSVDPADMDGKIFVIGNERECSKKRCDVIKLGPKGARWGEVFVRGNGVESPYRIGSGDVFDVVFLALLLKGKEKREIMEWAVSVSQDLSGRVKGAFNKMLSLEQFDPFHKVLFEGTHD